MHPSHVRNAAVMYACVCMLCVVALMVWGRVRAHVSSGELTVSFFDVGQGDAALITGPNGSRVLIDGGKDRSVLRELGAALPWDDRRLDVVIATHPDLDHIGGLPEVFARYDVGMFMEPCVRDDGADYEALRAAVTREGLETVCAREGMVLALEEGALLTILFPDRDVTGLDANVASIVARLSYGDTSFLFTGDSPTLIETYLLERHGDTLRSAVLKLAHHGSNTSSHEAYLSLIAPKYAVVSAGCDNTYGHPHPEVVKRVEHVGATLYATCTHSSITFLSDGAVLLRKR